MVTWQNEKNPISAISAATRLKWGRALPLISKLTAELFMSSTFLIFKRRFLHRNRVGTNNVDHVLCEHRNSSLSSSWTQNLNSSYQLQEDLSWHFSMDWVQQMSSEVLNPVITYIHISKAFHTFWGVWPLREVRFACFSVYLQSVCLILYAQVQTATLQHLKEF